ncbi:hypothetical protein ERJ75_001412400 [Trypanosoma vivax]|nr:hypothetical protein ERJ75_001412400 [Trypanosoma vivax]
MVGHRLLFPLGLLVVVHSICLAFGVREALQRHHHGTDTGGVSPSVFPALHKGNTHIDGSNLYIFLELFIGMGMAMIGYVKISTFKRARLVDKNCFERYDSIAHTGVGFMHFNHRGAAAGSRGKKGPNGEATMTAQKKNV